MSFRYCESLYVCERFANAIDAMLDELRVRRCLTYLWGESDESGSDEFAVECSETSRCVFVVFADERLCTGNAFATARTDIELCANFRERGRTGIHRSTDGSVGNVVADANNHGGLVMCKCEQFLFRLLTKPCSIARGFLNSCRGRQKEEIAPEAGVIGLGR